MSDELMQGRRPVSARSAAAASAGGFERPDGERRARSAGADATACAQRRQEQLNRYDLGSILDDIKERLEQIVETERDGIDRRLDEARRAATEPGGEQPAGRRRKRRAVRPAAVGSTAGRRAASSGDRAVGSGRAVERQRLDPDLQKHAGADGRARSASSSTSCRTIRRGAIRELQRLRLHGPRRRGRSSRNCWTMLQQQVMQQTFQGMQQALGEMTPEDIAEMRQMMQRAQRDAGGAGARRGPELRAVHAPLGPLLRPRTSSRSTI